MNNLLDNFIFFGSSELSVVVLNELVSAGLKPALVVTLPAKPAGRKMLPQDPELKKAAHKLQLSVIQPARFDSQFIAALESAKAEVFVVAAYGKIIPRKILEIPKLGSFNIHPSLLPKYRGPSPIQSQILNQESNIGVTIIRMDEQVDHGPILAQSSIGPSQDKDYVELGSLLFKEGTKLLINSLPKLKNGEAKLVAQNDSLATFTEKFKSQDGEIDIKEPEKAWLKYLALGRSPGVYFMFKGKRSEIRLKITEALFRNGAFEPIKVIPAGKKEMLYADFLRGQI